MFASLLNGRNVNNFHLAIATLIVIAALHGANAQTQDKDPAARLNWVEAQELSVDGRAWHTTKAPYDRLPVHAEAMVRKPVWDLSRHSSGMCVRFSTDAESIHARWVLTNPWLSLPNMAATGVSGLDLYVRFDNRWRWLGVGQPTAQTNTVALARNLLPGKREYLLYLPLHNGIRSVEIGVSTNAIIEMAAPREPGRRKPVLFYGTSIQQGLCASRPGMVHNAILGRRFNWPTINLGFSGQGKMEPELAQLLAELDPAVYVLDCLPNMDAALVKGRVEPFVQTLREARPETPIVLVEDRTMQDAFLVKHRQAHHDACRRELTAAFERLKAAGTTHLYYIEGEDLFGTDGEGSADGSHPNDLGFTRQAEVFAATLAPLLHAE